MVARSAASGSFNVSAMIASAPSRKLAATTGFVSTVGEARDDDGLERRSAVQNLIPANVYFGSRTSCWNAKGSNATLSNSDDCNIIRKPPKLQLQRNQSRRSNTARIVPKRLKMDSQLMKILSQECALKLG